MSVALLYRWLRIIYQLSLWDYETINSTRVFEKEKKSWGGRGGKICHMSERDWVISGLMNCWSNVKRAWFTDQGTIHIQNWTIETNSSTYCYLALNRINYHWWMLGGIKIRKKEVCCSKSQQLSTLLRYNGDKPQTNRTWNLLTAETMFGKPRWGVNGVWSMNVQHNNDTQLPYLLLTTEGLLKDQ